MENITSTIIKEYLMKYPEMPSLTLAKLVYKNNSVAFNSIEHARSLVRTYRGANGGLKRQSLKDRRFIREIQVPYNPFSLPDSDEREFEAFVVPDNCKKLLVFGDVHIPYHSIEALTLMIKYAKAQKVDSILINGDLIDFYQLSCFIKDPRNRHFKQELDATIQFLKVLKKELKCLIYWKLGNHCERLNTYMKLKAPELLGIDAFELESLIGLSYITYIKDKRTVKFGKLNILHGHELKGAIIPPVNAARGVFLRTKENTLVNHFHTDSKHSESNLSGDIVSCWSIGMMCEIHPDYATNNRWSHGFAIVDRLEDGDFIVSTKQIIKGKIL